MQTNFIIIFVACASKNEADKILVSLLKKKLVACGSVIRGVQSKFWWLGKIDKADETILMLKTKRRAFNAIEDEVRSLHSYEVPEIIALPVVTGSGPYLDWINKTIK